MALPALTRARKLGARAAQAGFDWPDAAGPRAKIDEELAELDAVRDAADPAAREAELGDLLFSVVNLARHLEVDPETALRGANGASRDAFATLKSNSSASASPSVAQLPSCSTGSGSRRSPKTPESGCRPPAPAFRTHSLAPP